MRTRLLLLTLLCLGLGPVTAEASHMHVDDFDKLNQRMPRLASAGTAPEREPVCATGPRTRVVYASLNPRLNQQLVGELRGAVREANWILARDSRDSGGGSADLRVACDGDGRIAITPLAAPALGFTDVRLAASLAGLRDPDEDLLVLADGLNDSCGAATLLADDRLTAANKSNSGGGFAVVFRSCWGALGVLHEVAHMQGAVQASAPNSTGTGGHCNTKLDFLCYTPDGGDRNQGRLDNRCPKIRFDCNFDDYFDAAPEPGEYLASHWNLGSPLNSFIEFSNPAADRTTVRHRSRPRGAVRIQPAAAGRGLDLAVRLRGRSRRAPLRVALRGARSCAAECPTLELAGRRVRCRAAASPCKARANRRGRLRLAVNTLAGDAPEAMKLKMRPIRRARRR